MSNNIPFRNADYALDDKHTKAAVIRLSGNDSLADLSETTIEFNTTTYNGVNTDPDNLFDTSDYKLKTPGRYFVSLNTSILANNNIAKSGSITFALLQVAYSQKYWLILYLHSGLAMKLHSRMF